MDRNKIVHLIGVFPSKSETFIINQIIVSIENGFEATILADVMCEISNSSQQNLLEKYDLFNTAQSFTPQLPKNKVIRVLKAIALLFLNLPSYKVFFKSLNTNKFEGKASSLKLWYQAAFFLKYKDTAVFHAHFGINGTVLADLKEIGAIKGKIIVSFYGYDTFSTEHDRESIKKYYERLFEHSSVILVNSKYLRHNLFLLNAPDEKIKVNHVGVDQSIFKSKSRETGLTFKMITIGRLIALKGHEYGLMVVRKLKEKGHKIHYTIVGEGEECDNLLKQINALDIQNEVTLFGVANQEKILDLLYEHDLFLMTSITDITGRAEGQGLVTAEAQATGMPAIGFDSGGVGETILDGKSGYIVPEKDIDAMVDKIEFLMNNNDLKNDMAKNAVSFVSETFNNNKQANNILRIYKALI